VMFCSKQVSCEHTCTALVVVRSILNTRIISSRNSLSVRLFSITMSNFFGRAAWKGLQHARGSGAFHRSAITRKIDNTRSGGHHNEQKPGDSVPLPTGKPAALALVLTLTCGGSAAIPFVGVWWQQRKA